MRRALVAVGLVLALAGCSGGGDKTAAPSPTPSPTLSPKPVVWTQKQACAYLLGMRTKGNKRSEELAAVVRQFNAGKVSWRAVRDKAASFHAERLTRRKQITYPPYPWPKAIAVDFPTYRKGLLLRDSWETVIGKAKNRDELVYAYGRPAMSDATEDAYTSARENLKATCNWAE